MEQFWKSAAELLTQAAGKIIIAILVFIIGRLIIKGILKLMKKAKFMDKLDPTVRSFITSFVRIGLYVVLVISIIGVLGVPMASVVTVLASCGVAVGLALQGALSNLAGGIMLLIFRPFKVGDYISAAGEEGTVKEVTLFYTIVNTVDNKQVTIPNGTLMGANVTNFSAEDHRRVDLSFNIGAGNDIDTVKQTILSVIKDAPDADNTIQEPFVAPMEGVPGGLKYSVRVWTSTDKYWNLYTDLMKRIPEALAAAGIGGPLTHIQVEDNK